VAPLAGGGRGDGVSLPLRPLRVVVTGSESTGKTTLAGALAARFGAPWSAEYARLYLERVARPLGPGDVESIARGQLEAEDAVRRTAAGLAVHDTDLLSTVVYARHYYGRCPAWIERAALERRADLYLLCHPDVPWVADGLQRDREQARAALHRLFGETLAEFAVATVDIRGSWTERAAAAESAIAQRVGGRDAGPARRER
jgi:NadR type nicotinamide-nucleotide adenylyltransferase